MTEKFDLMKILKEKETKEKLKFEGAILAFKLPDGKNGTAIFCNDLGVALRLMNEASVQERVLEIQNNDIAAKHLLNAFSNQKEEKVRSSMFG